MNNIEQEEPCHGVEIKKEKPAHIDEIKREEPDHIDEIMREEPGHMDDIHKACHGQVQNLQSVDTSSFADTFWWKQIRSHLQNCQNGEGEDSKQNKDFCELREMGKH